MAHGAAVFVEGRPPLRGERDGCSRVGNVNSGARGDAGLPHEIAPLRAVREPSSPMPSVDHEVCGLVADDLFLQFGGQRENDWCDPNEAALRIAAAKRAPEPVAEGDRQTLREQRLVPCCGAPFERPSCERDELDVKGVRSARHRCPGYWTPHHSRSGTSAILAAFF